MWPSVSPDCDGGIPGKLLRSPCFPRPRGNTTASCLSTSRAPPLTLLQRMAPASSYPIALAPLLPGSFSPIASRISAEVLTGDTPLVYITSKGTPKSRRRGSADAVSQRGMEEGQTDGHVATVLQNHWNNSATTSTAVPSFSADRGEYKIDPNMLTLSPYTLSRDDPCHSSHMPCIATPGASRLSPLNHIAPGLHHTSLTLASPVLGCSGYMHKECCALNVPNHWKEHKLPYIRRRSVNVPLDVGNKQDA
ncbi:hypothetical protein FHG87_007582 [Trinorchestia longiramus]|nr:hypothetical protein FHG87_007582 [Trinorchestia longiramus]